MATSLSPETLAPETLAPETLATLLQHSGWVRHLAGSLLRNDALADDLAQETWVAALAHPPTPGLPVRPWLAQVLRNLIRMRFRSERRRQGRETQEGEGALGSGRHLDSPEQLVARVDLQRLLGDHVLALPEPFRSTLLLRFYEGLSAAEIAARQEVPAGTVRWRLKTGLDRLRESLDRAHHGDRRAWQSLVAPLAIEPSPAVELPPPPGAPSAGLLSGKAWLSLGLFVSLAATGLFWAVGRVHPSRPSPAAPSQRVAVVSAAAARAPRLSPPERAQLLAQITQAQASAQGRSEPSPRRQPELDADYIREQMQALLPLIKECYEHALDEKPQLAGRLMVSFTIVAEPDVGGLVSDSKIDGAASTIDDEGLRECVQETMYGARFPAPRDGGELRVTYPFILAPAP